MNINESTAQRVAAAITTTGNSVAGVAAATLIPRSTLQRKLAGKSPISVIDLHVIARALGVRSRDLLPDELLNDHSQAA